MISRSIHQSSKSWLEQIGTRAKKHASRQRNVPPFHHFVQIGNPVLREKATPIPESEINSSFVRHIADRLLQVMEKYDATGASAPQIGIPLAMFAVGFTHSQLQYWSPEVISSAGMETIVPERVFINPTIKVLDSNVVTMREGCCSMYGFSAEVPRAKKVIVKGLDPYGASIEWVVSDWSARIVQHEMDHLNGKLFIDPPSNTQSISFDYWRSIDQRKGDFKLSYGGVGSTHRFLPFKFFFKRSL